MGVLHCRQMQKEIMTQEIIQEEVKAHEEPSNQPQGEAQQAEEAAQETRKEPSKSNAEINWEQTRQLLQMQKQKIEDLESRLVEREKPSQVDEKDEFSELDPDDYLTVGKARKLAEKLAEKKATEAAKKIVQEYSQQQTVQNDEHRMRSKHDDYDFVVENFAIPLIKNDPALAYQIQHSKNPAETAYKLGKLSDSYEESTMKQQTSPKAEKVLKNASRPVSANAVGSSLKNQSENFAKMSPQEIWAESQKYARRA